MRVLLAVAGKAAAKWADALQRELPEAELAVRDAGLETADPNAEQADYVLLWRPHPSLFAEQRCLKAVFNLGAGVDALAAMDAFPRSVPLIRLEDAGMAAPMAQYTLAAVLRYAYRFDEYALQQRQRRWTPHRPRKAREVAVGIMGLGAIGATIARTIAAHGFDVRGFARSARTLDSVRCFAGNAQFSGFLNGLHVLVNVLPLTDETRGILRREHLTHLADGAHLVNLARGAHLSETDLLKLLDEGKLSGATLDVFEREPLPPEHPFWVHPSITVTPHVAGVTLLEASVEQIAHKIRLLERGEPVSGMVDWKRGY